jgi:ABC-type Mn2+/Zn2+ transport system ATPase subunit
MPVLNINRSTAIKRTPRVVQLEGLFDVPPTKRSEVAWRVNLPIEEKPWQIGLVVGPSGCGKSTLARELFGKSLVSGYEWPSDCSIVDGFPAGMSMKEITLFLSSVGFSSPPSWLRPFGVLSNGEQFRATIARALA